MCNEAKEMEHGKLCDAQIAYYSKLTSDLNRYRNFRWYIPMWTVSFLAAASAIGKNTPDMHYCVRGGATVAIVGVAAISMYQLWKCYTCYAENRKAVRDIERNYGLLALGLKKWHKEEEKRAADGPKLTWPHRVIKWSWLVLITLVALYALYCVWPQQTDQFLAWLAAPTCLENV
jgi:hypothetical protein